MRQHHQPTVLQTAGLPTAGSPTAGLPVAREHQEQVALFQWARMMSGRHPELLDLFAIPNGGLRPKHVGGWLKAEGVKAGVPDIWLPHPRRGYAALCIELKRENGHASDLSAEQRLWQMRLNDAGNCAVTCLGWLGAKSRIEWYLSGR